MPPHPWSLFPRPRRFNPKRTTRATRTPPPPEAATDNPTDLAYNRPLAPAHPVHEGGDGREADLPFGPAAVGRTDHLGPKAGGESHLAHPLPRTARHPLEHRPPD